MRELSVKEVSEVSGGLEPELGMALIAGLVFVAVIVAAPAAAAFGGGVLVVNEIANAMD